jgi:hypothetical protein
LAGTASEQFIDAAACAAVCCVLMAAPVPSTGFVATSPSRKLATAPPANDLAGATVAAVPVLVPGLALALGLAVPLAVALPVALALAVALAVALALAMPDADAVGLADGG